MAGTRTTTKRARPLACIGYFLTQRHHPVLASTLCSWLPLSWRFKISSIEQALSCEVGSLMLAYRYRVRDLGCRFPRTRHKHIGSKPTSRASLRRLDSMHGWLPAVLSSCKIVWKNIQHIGPEVTPHTPGHRWWSSALSLPRSAAPVERARTAMHCFTVMGLLWRILR